MNQPRKTLGSGDAIGISADGRVLTSAGRVVSPDGSQVVLVGARTPLVLDDERVLGFQFTGSGTRIAEWNLNGDLIRGYDSGVEPIGVNNQGALLGTYGPSTIDAGVWFQGAWSRFSASKKPKPYYYGDITEQNVVVGTYQAANGSTHAARWMCG